MGKFIGKKLDRYNNVTYVVAFNEENVEYGTNIRNAMLLSEDDKKTITKILKKTYKPSISYVKLEKFDSINATTHSALYGYEHNFLADAAKFAKKQDNMSLECISFAQTNLDEIKTFGEFGDSVAKILIEKYNLKKKEQL